jgi:transposase
MRAISRPYGSRACRVRRREKHAAAVATVRYETAPGTQMQIDFGQKKVRSARQWSWCTGKPC